MLWVVGERSYGEIERYGSTRVTTRFVHVMYVPIVPHTSYVMIDENEGFAVPIVWRSVIAGLGRVWSIFFVVGAVCAVPLSALLFFTNVRWGVIGLVSSLLRLLGTVAASIATFRMGKLDVDGRTERHAYAMSFGLAVDPAFLAPERRSQIRSALLDALAQRTGGYRGETPPWELLASDPGGMNVETIAYAMTIARIDETFGYNAAERPRLRATRARLVAALRNLVAA